MQVPARRLPCATMFGTIVPSKNGKDYRTAILESDPRKLATRVEKAEAAIVARSQQLSESSATHNKEQEAIVRAH